MGKDRSGQGNKRPKVADTRARAQPDATAPIVPLVTREQREDLAIFRAALDKLAARHAARHAAVLADQQRRAAVTGCAATRLRVVDAEPMITPVAIEDEEPDT